MNWEKVDIIDYENFLCLGLNESGFHTRFFLEIAKEQCNKGCLYSGWQGLYYLVLCRAYLKSTMTEVQVTKDDFMR